MNYKNMINKFICNPFILPSMWSFILVGIYIFPDNISLISVSGDASSIWQTITSFRSETITSSYVLYKGFLSVYPYVWLYELSIFLGLNQFILIKIYHALLFSFVSAIGIPYIISRLIKVRIGIFRNLIFITLLFFLTSFTHIYDALMIDLPSWAYFVAAVAVIMYINNNKKSSCYQFAIYLLAGVLVGLSFAASGQYSISAFLLSLYFIISRYGSLINKEIPSFFSLILILMVFAIGVSIPKSYDKYFHSSIVQPMRDAGEWLPTGEAWLKLGLTRTIPLYKYGYPDISNRGRAILKEAEGENYESRMKLLGLGGGAYSTTEYINIVIDNFFNFLIIWFTQLFLSISFDGGAAKILNLLIAYTALFSSFYILFIRLKKFDQIFHRDALIVMAFIATIAAPVILWIDMRLIVCLFGFILGLFIFQNSFFSSMLQSRVFLITLSKKYFIPKIIFINRIPYLFIAYIIFIIICFLLYGALLEIPGSDPAKVLFRL